MHHLIAVLHGAGWNKGAGWNAIFHPRGAGWNRAIVFMEDLAKALRHGGGW